MSFANPWGLLALAALPGIIALHLYHRRYPPLLIGGLHLWGVETEVRRAGRRRERLPITASLLLELLAALLLALVLAQPRWSDTKGVEHLVLVLDNSASMQSRPPGAVSFRDSARAAIEQRLDKLPKGSVATLILTGRRPTMLAGPAASIIDARKSLERWQPNAPQHGFESAWFLASQLAEGGGRMLFASDHLPPKEAQTPETMEVLAFGRPLENVAIAAARWNYDAAAKKGRIFLRLANHGKRAAELSVRATKGDQQVFERSVSLQPAAESSLEAEVAGGLGEIRVNARAKDDALAIDNEVTLIEPSARMLTVAQTLPAGHAAATPVRRALAGIADLQSGDAGNAQLIIGAAKDLPASRRTLSWLGIGPLDSAEPAKKAAKDLVGPFLLEKRHALLDGVSLGGVVFGGVQPQKLDAVPLVSGGKTLLLARIEGTQTSAYVLNLDFARSNLAESPDWPVLIKNLVDSCRENQPGLKRWNYRLNEEITFRADFAADVEQKGDLLQLVHDGKTRPLARGSVIEVPPLEETGVYEVRDGEKSLGRFAVNFQDADESTLLALTPGERAPSVETPAMTYQLDDPFSWLIAAAIVAILAAALGDWFVLRGLRPRTSS